MAFTQSERAIYLFCAPLSQTRTTPLTVAEWQFVREALTRQHLRPKHLLTTTVDLPAAIATKITARQQLGLALYEVEDAIQQGYRIMFDEAMPTRLLRMPKTTRPPYLYYSGDKSLLAMPHCVAILQSEVLTHLPPHTIITPLFDEAVIAYLQRGARAIIVTAQGLNFWTRKKIVRDFIASGQLVLITMQPPGSKSKPMWPHDLLCQWLADAVVVSDTPLDSALFTALVDNCEHQWSPIFTVGNGQAVDWLVTTKQATPFTTFGAPAQHEPSRLPELLDLLTPPQPAWQQALYAALDEASQHTSPQELSDAIKTYFTQQ